MNTFIYVAFSILTVVVFYLIFRVLRILDLIRGRKEEEISGTQNTIQAVLLFVFFAVGMYWFFSYGSTEFSRYVLPVASEHGVVVEEMFWVTMTLTLIVFVVTHLLLVLFGYIYRYNSNRRASHYHENDRLEIVWTVIPGLVLMGLIFNGWVHWEEITAPAPEDAEVIEIVGYQFAWASRYGGKDKKIGKSDYRLIDADNSIGIDFSDTDAEDDFMPREIYIPKGRPVKFEIRSLDVIHSFYVPHLRVQMYAVPGMGTSFWVTPTKTTKEMRTELNDPEFNYQIACNKICGRAHFSMFAKIIIIEPEAYDQWYSEQKSWLEKNPEYQNKLAKTKNLPQLVQKF